VAKIMRNRWQFSNLVFDEDGAAAIEFGVIASVLCFLFLGLIDFGMGYWQKIQVGNAARAGAEYAANNGWNQSNISTAVTSATGLGSISATPAPTQSCGCPNASSGITTATCGSSCAGGGTAGTYVSVNAKATYTSIVTYPGIANPLTLAASAIGRIN